MTVKPLGNGQYIGLSTDTKPSAANTAVSAIFEETDSQEEFINIGSTWVRRQKRQLETDYVVSVSGANYSVLDTSTGITTTSTNLRALIDTIADVLCTSPRVGGKILFKKGTYLPTARLDFPNTDTLTTPTTTHAIDNVCIEIQGEDRDQTIIKMTVDNNHIIQPRCNFIIRDITLDGNLQSANGITSNYKIRFEAHNCVIRKCGKGNPATGGWNGFGIWLGNDITGGDFTNGVKSFIIDKCRLYEQNSIQEDICPTATEFGIVTRCYFDRTWADTQGWKGSQLTGGSGQQVIYTNNIFTRPPGNELSVTRELNGDVKNNIISNNIIKNGRILIGFSGMGLDIVRIRNIKISDNVMPGGRIHIRGPDTNQSGAAITDPAVWRQIIRDVVIENNIITDSYFNAIHLFRCEDVIVRNNYIKNSNVGALAVSHADAGLVRVDNAFNIEINDNRLVMDTAATGYAVRYNNSTTVLVRFNSIRNASGNPTFTDGGTNSGVIVPTTNPDTTAATLPNVEIEVNQLKQTLRDHGLLL